MPTKLFVAFVPFGLVLAACGGSDDTSSSDTVASTVSDIPRLTFDGSGCFHDGPQEVTAGVVAVELVNDSDGRAAVFVGRLDEGKTVEDVLEISGTEPSRGGGQMPWVADMGGQSGAAAGETIRWESSLAAGQYMVTCTTRAGAWFSWTTGLSVVNG